MHGAIEQAALLQKGIPIPMEGSGYMQACSNLLFHQRTASSTSTVNFLAKITGKLDKEDSKGTCTYCRST